jgi:surface polysaccharide O-acyltransferase-like enzyme
MKKNNQNNYREIELLRGFAILAVISLHSTKDFVYTNNQLITILFATVSAIVLCGVPIFIFISGFLLSLKSDNNYTILNFYKKRFEILIPPYIIFSFLYLYLYHIFITPFELTLEDLYTILVRILTATAFYHLWFFGLIAQIYLFYPFINKIVLRFKGYLFILLILSVFIQIIWIAFRMYVFDFIDNYKDLGFIYVLINVPLQYLFLSYIAYFMLGIYIRENYEKIIKIVKCKKASFFLFSIMLFLIIILSYLWISGTFKYGSFFNMPGEYFARLNVLGSCLYSIIVIFLLKMSLYLVKKRNIFEKILIKFGQYSLGIYLIHAAFLAIITIVLNIFNVNYNYWYFFLICFIATASVSLIMVHIISSFPYHRFLIGKIRNWDDPKINVLSSIVNKRE